MADIDCDSAWRGERPPPSSWAWRIAEPILALWLAARERVAARREPAAAWEAAFGHAKRLLPDADEIQRRCLARLALRCAQDPMLAFRVYQTTRGFRAIEPSRALLDSLSCDGVYASLCRKQGCFRARLQAKPWRCGSSRPSARYPFEDAASADAFQAWLAEFEPLAASRQACRFLGTVGQGIPVAGLDRIAALHDAACRALDPGLRLA